MWNSNLFYEKLLDGWERSETSNGLPYYINHKIEQTQWDHPLLEKMFEELVDLNSIRYAAYRTAMKLRYIQRRLGFDQVSLHNLQTVLERRGLAGGVDTVVDCVDLYGILIDVFHVARSVAKNLTTEQQAELALNLLLNLYDVNRTGCIRLASVNLGIAAICSARLSEKYRYFFNRMADNTNHLTRKRLGCLLHDLIQIPEVMNESQPFGGLNVTAAVESCFSMAWGLGATEDMFLSWLLREPQTLVWLPTMHRMVAAESVKHESKCNTCKVYPIIGFRYKCLKCFNYDSCQQCFFTGRVSKNHKLKHPIQEYCIATTPKEDTKAFMKTLRNNLSRKHRNKRKLRYLPIYGSEESRNPKIFPGPDDVPPPDMHMMMRATANRLSAKSQLPQRDDAMDPQQEHQGKDKVDGLHIGNLQRKELENVINHLESENRELMYEIERLHQRRSDSGSERGSDDARWCPGEEDGEGRGSPPYHAPDQPDAHRDVLKAHNQQLEIQLQRLRYILNEREAEPTREGRRSPLRPASPSMPPVKHSSRPLTTAVMTPPRILKQPPAYATTTSHHAPSPGRSFALSTTSFLQPSTSSSLQPHSLPLSYDDHVDSALVDISRAAHYTGYSTVNASYGSMGGALSRTHFELPSVGESQYFPHEEAELAELIERLNHAYPADVSQSVLDRDSTTVREMGRAANQMGEAFGQHPLDGCADGCG